MNKATGVNKATSVHKLAAFLVLFRKGAAVSDPQVWKQRQITATVLASLIMAAVGVANAYGYVLPIDNETALAIAGGVLGIVNTILTITTTEKIGIGDSSALDSGEVRTEEHVRVELTADTQQPVQEQQVEAGAVQSKRNPNIRAEDSFYQN